MSAGISKNLFLRLIYLCATLILIIALFARLYSPQPESLNYTEKPLVVVWELADNVFDPSEVDQILPVDVVSPTWFRIVDEEGSISNQVDTNYINWARSHGYQIWALASNSFDPDITAAILSDPKIRQQVANDLVELILLYELDGINIDFENFHADYRDYFTLFIRELGALCKDEGIILSVDVTMISTSEYWSLCYDRPALAVEADYIILMAYDEHYKYSPVPGSVSSLPWVEQGIQQILNEVPAEKLILGVPFYTRLWVIKDYETNPVITGSYSYSMHRASKIIEENDAEIYFDDYAGQYVARYNKDDLTYKMWLEDSHSMHSRLKLADYYKLAGIAGWRRGLEKPEIWDLINEFF